jgi:pectinesterase
MRPGIALFLAILLLPAYVIRGNERYADVTVAWDGSGDYRSITEALGAMPMFNYQRYVIFIKNGVYNEKILLDRDYVTILGESRNSTIIQYSQLRSDWQTNPDHIGAAVINITADDVILESLTIRNTQPQMGPHAFAVYGTGTRIIIENCRVTSKGGDTVSLWNYKDGMYYHANCYFEGGIDFVCPRGWCYIRDSRFYENDAAAALWHAAVTNKDQKLVLNRCSFDGVKGFQLARHHYEAQFWFLDCTFSETMADEPILHFLYADEPEKNRPYFYGDRYYFYGNHRTGGDYPWHRDNRDYWPKGLSPSDITPEWTFGGLWDPESEKKPAMTGYSISGLKIIIFFNESICVRGKVILETSTGRKLIFSEGVGRDMLAFTAEIPLKKKDFMYPLVITSGELIGNTASVKERCITALVIN